MTRNIIPSIIKIFIQRSWQLILGNKIFSEDTQRNIHHQLDLKKKKDKIMIYKKSRELRSEK